MQFKNYELMLSKNFKLAEFRVSSQYPAIVKDMVMNVEDVLNLKLLAIECLQVIRDKFGPIVIESGYRDMELNNLVGGERYSDHRSGNASDIVIRNFDNEQVFKWIVEESQIPYRQVIWYPYTRNKFIHISNNNITKNVKHEALVSTEQRVYVPYDSYYGVGT